MNSLRKRYGLLAFALAGVLFGMVAQANASSDGWEQINLVADRPGAAQFVDSKLINPWGLTNTTNRIIAAQNGTGLVTSYDPGGNPKQFSFKVPVPGSSASAAPTGLVINDFNLINAFPVSQGGKTATSEYVMVTEQGTIAGWSPGVNKTTAVTMVDNSASGAIYKGVALVSSNIQNNRGPWIAATNFHANRVEIYSSNSVFTLSFTDPTAPAGYAPYGIYNWNGILIVTFAKQDALGKDSVSGPGLGFIDLFLPDGTLVKRLVDVGGLLNAPWGLEIASTQSMGIYNNTLLVGNFGDGAITSYKIPTGELVGQLHYPSGSIIHIDGLWGLRTSKDSSKNKIYFTAGTGGEAHGLLGILKAMGPNP